MFLRIPGTAQFHPELYVMLLVFVDAAAHRVRRGRSRPLAVYYLYAPLSRSNTGRGEEDLMIFAFMKGAPPWQV